MHHQRVLNTRRRRTSVAVCTYACLLLLATACYHPSAASSGAEITRERAIEIARAEVSFTPDSIETVRASSQGRPIWRVTFRGRLPGQPPGLFETVIVEVHRQTGAIVSIAKT